ncbi:FecR family protein [Chitinophagaceae bacterium 26-R-25]|nr:FecR family protein [Chitinophagaceae bacterium 26-R-25]
MFKKLFASFFSKGTKSLKREEPSADFDERDAHTVLSEEDWEAFDVPAGEYSEAKEAFVQNLFAQDSRQKRAVQLYRSVAAAAVVIIIAGTLFFVNRKDTGSSVAFINHAPTDVQFVVNSNTTAQNTIIALPDQSEVTLSPGSEIKYLPGFGNDQRNIYVTGDAVFKVQKSSAHPFTVYCKNVVTIALGTTFRVSQKSTAGDIAVTLMEGKVVVRNADNEANENHYLQPGNCIAFNAATGEFKLVNNKELLAEVNEGASKESANSQEETKEEKHSSQKEINATTTPQNKLQFKNAPLSRVLDDLAHTYHVEIVYPTKKVATINFIGEVVKQGSLDKILSDIALMNDFKLIIDSTHHKYELQ